MTEIVMEAEGLKVRKPEKKNVFEILNAINVNDHVEKKNGLSYLSWAWAWAEIKKAFPDSSYIIYERSTEYGPVNYFTDGRTAWVKTGVIIEGLEHIEELPVMDYNNRSITLDKLTSFDVNKAIQRSLTKACARHGLGLYIYAGEDLPEGETAALNPRLKELKDNQVEWIINRKDLFNVNRKEDITDEIIDKFLDMVNKAKEGKNNG